MVESTQRVYGFRATFCFCKNNQKVSSSRGTIERWLVPCSAFPPANHINELRRLTRSIDQAHDRSSATQIWSSEAALVSRISDSGSEFLTEEAAALKCRWQRARKGYICDMLCSTTSCCNMVNTEVDSGYICLFPSTIESTFFVLCVHRPRSGGWCVV